MTTTVMLGSRIYQPIGDVDRELAALTDGDQVLGMGSSPVARRAADVAKARGLDGRNVTMDNRRDTLLAAAREPNAIIALFICRDPDTKQPTEGISQIVNLLESHGIAFRRVESPLPGRVCKAITDLLDAVTKANDTTHDGRRRVIVSRALKLATAVIDLRDSYETKMEIGFRDELDNDASTEKWLVWEQAYRACSDALTTARSILDTKVAA